MKNLADLEVEFMFVEVWLIGTDVVKRSVFLFVPLPLFIKELKIIRSLDVFVASKTFSWFMLFLKFLFFSSFC